MSTDKQQSLTRVITGKVRFSYATLFKARSMNPGDEPKYSVSLIIPKSDKKTVDLINKAIDEAIKVGHEKGTFPKSMTRANLKLPLRDGDAERSEKPEYKNSWFINANSKQKPQVVDVDRNEIIDPLDLVSGDYGRVSVNFYPFKNKSVGIAAGLGNVQKLENGEPLGNITSADQDFGSDFDNEDDI